MLDQPVLRLDNTSNEVITIVDEYMKVATVDGLDGMDR